MMARGGKEVGKGRGGGGGEDHGGRLIDSFCLICLLWSERSGRTGKEVRETEKHSRGED